jgi:hypothetical protein
LRVASQAGSELSFRIRLGLRALNFQFSVVALAFLARDELGISTRV